MAFFGPSLQKIIEPFIGRFLAGENDATELAARIRSVIEDQSQHLPSQIAFSNLMSKFVVNGIDLLNYNDSKDPIKYKIAGLTIFDCLLDVNDEIMPERRIEIANHIGKVMENDKQPLSANEVVLRTASLSIGHFARVASTTEIEFLHNYYYPLALKLIGDSRSDAHRYSGAIILTQLAHYAPALIFSKRRVLFNVIWDAVCDRSKSVRTAAAATLEASLQVISQREAMSDYIRSALKQIDNGFTSAITEKILGSLIILDTLMSGAVVSFAELNNTMRQQGVSVPDLIWKVLQRKDWRDVDIRIKIIELLPNMASAFSNAFLQPNTFTSPNTFLAYGLKHYMDCIVVRKERDQCYKGLTRLFLAMPTHFKSASTSINEVFQVIISGFKDPFSVEALPCFTTLLNVSLSSRKLIENKVIDLLFRGGLTPQLVDTLKVVIKHVPSIRIYAQGKLKTSATTILDSYMVTIDEKATKLSARTTRLLNPLPATPSSSQKSGLWFGGSKPSTPVENTVEQQAALEKVEDEIAFALQVLAMPEIYSKTRERSMAVVSGITSPGFAMNTNAGVQAATSGDNCAMNTAQSAEEEEATELLSMARDSVLRYMDDFNPKIRQAAAETCATILHTVLPSMESLYSSSSAGCSVSLSNSSSCNFYLLHQILDRLLIMGVGDDSHNIRCNVLAAITPAMDRALAQTDNVHCLVEALNDDWLGVRIAAMTILGRVAHYDLLHIMPIIRLMLKRLLATLALAQDSKVKLEHVLILQALVHGSDLLIIPYVRQILSTLMILLNERNAEDVMVVALSTIGELATSSPESVREHLDELGPCLIALLNDESSVVKQQTAVIALGKLVSSLATPGSEFEEPYKRYAGLFEGLVKAAQHVEESSTELRLQAIKTLGLLGAVDVSVYQHHLRSCSAGMLGSSCYTYFYRFTTDGDEEVVGIEGGVGAERESLVDSDDESDDGVYKKMADNGLAVESGANGYDGGDGVEKLTKIEKHYFHVVIRGLMSILRDSSLSFNHPTAITTAVRAIRILGSRASTELDEVISAILYRLYQADSGNNIKDTLLDHCISLIHIIGGRGLKRHAQDLTKVIQDFLPTHLQLCLDILESLLSVLGTPDVQLVLQDILPTLIRTIEEEIMVNSDSLLLSGDGLLEDDLNPTSSSVVTQQYGKSVSGHLGSNKLAVAPSPSMSDRSARRASSASGPPGTPFHLLPSHGGGSVNGLGGNGGGGGLGGLGVGNGASGGGSGGGSSNSKTSRILQKFVNLMDYLGEIRRALVPFIISIVDNVHIPPEMRREALRTLLHLSNASDLPEYAGRIIHAILRLLSSSYGEGSLLNAALNALACLLCRLGTGYLPYIVPVRRKLKQVFGSDLHGGVGNGGGGSGGSELVSGGGTGVGGMSGTNRGLATPGGPGVGGGSSGISGGGSVPFKISRLEEYEALVNRLLKQRPLPTEPSDMVDIACTLDERVRSRATTAHFIRDNSFAVNISSLETAWALAGRNNASDLSQWMGRLTIELIRQSPSPIIRACATLAKTHRPLAEELFNTSFHSVWEHLFAYQQGNEVIIDLPLINGIETALESQQIPKPIMISLLNLAEFMEMQDRALPIDVQLLARRAQDANMFAKSLHYREREFSSKNLFPPSLECIDALVTVSNQLGLADRAIGLLRYLRMAVPHVEIQPRWLEKLLRWEDAYHAYEADIQQCKVLFGHDPTCVVVPATTSGSSSNCSSLVKQERWLMSEVGRLRCLHALGENEELELRARTLLQSLKKEVDRGEGLNASASAMGAVGGVITAGGDKSAPAITSYSSYLLDIQRLGAHAAWRLAEWDKMEVFLEGDASQQLLPADPKDVVLEHHLAFYKAVLAIHHGEFNRALGCIQEMRAALSGSIAALLSESYSRATRAMITMQILAEMEEIVDYKQAEEKALEIGSAGAGGENGMSTNNLDGLASMSSGLGAGIPMGIRINVDSNIVDRDRLSMGIAGGAAAGSEKSATAASSTAMDLTSKRIHLLKKWKARLKWAPKDIEIYRQILAVHTLVAEPVEELDSWLELITLCRKEGMFTLCASMLRKLGAPLQVKRIESQVGLANLGSGGGNASSPSMAHPPPLSPSSSTAFNPTNERVLFSTFQYWWSVGEKERALAELTQHLQLTSAAFAKPPTTSTSSTSSSTALGSIVTTATNSVINQENTMFRVRCLLKRAEWMQQLQEDDVHGVLDTILQARDLAPDQYSVWHAWAVANYDQLKKVSSDEKGANVATPFGNSSPAGVVGGAGAEGVLTPLPPGHHHGAHTTAPTIISGSTGSGRESIQASPARHHRTLTPGSVGGGGGGGGNGNGNGNGLKLRSVLGAATLLNLVSVQPQGPDKVDKVTAYVAESIKGFVRSIILGQGQPVANLLQDTLRLITLMFSYGSKKGVFQILDCELEKVSPDNWLSVVPQLIARIHIRTPEISSLLRKLLVKLAASHPQALVCPISVALNTNDHKQRAVAADVLNEVRKTDPQLVEEATMVSRELMRVAITPHELWFDGLEQAAQLYLESKDISAMLVVLKDLHDTLADPPAPTPTASAGNLNTVVATATRAEGFTEGLAKIGSSTLRDLAFRQSHFKPLQEAQFWVDQFRKTGRTIDLHQAWEIYQLVFKRMKVQIAALKRLELHHVSPALTRAKNLNLAVPGTYKPSSSNRGAVISIKSFSPSVHVITSKQRPRRMALFGSDGKKYMFLLKGHEDLRQDERVMQLFGLINVCLKNDRLASHHDLSIVRYSVLPLSNNSGLLGWVENCDTMNQLVKQYREAKDIRLLLEVKLLQSKCLHYDKLTVMQKTELFQQVLDETTGEDLTKMLWLNSKTCDVWIERRAQFSKSLAVMSMVGYVLGLGDRHPSNLMLHRVSGQVVHIDFGDCFEITAHRSKYPEIVPFRLTRMLTKCMGVAGMEGTFRLTSERVMRVIRDNRYSVMAMLEAFVYDPLISWRLLTKHATGGGGEERIAQVNSTDETQARSPVELIVGSLLGGIASTIPDHPLGGGGGGNAVGGVVAGGGVGVESGAMERSPPRRGGAGSMLHRSLSHDINRVLAQQDNAEDEPFQENLNTRALEVVNRIQAKLTGRDFVKNDEADDLTVAEQVDRLIQEAKSIENLCQLFSGWCPLW